MRCVVNWRGIEDSMRCVVLIVYQQQRQRSLYLRSANSFLSIFHDLNALKFGSVQSRDGWYVQ